MLLKESKYNINCVVQLSLALCQLGFGGLFLPCQCVLSAILNPNLSIFSQIFGHDCSSTNVYDIYILALLWLTILGFITPSAHYNFLSNNDYVVVKLIKIEHLSALGNHVTSLFFLVKDLEEIFLWKLEGDRFFIYVWFLFFYIYISYINMCCEYSFELDNLFSISGAEEHRSHTRTIETLGLKFVHLLSLL